MNNMILGCMLAAALLSAPMAEAQGTLYVSSLGQSSIGSQPVGSDSWLAEQFQTGNNSGGYALNSIQLGMTAASGNPGAFEVLLYGANTDIYGTFPGTVLASLAGATSPGSLVLNHIFRSLS